MNTHTIQPADTKGNADTPEPSPKEGSRRELDVSDRSVPVWVIGFAVIFALARAAAMVSLAVAVFFLERLVVEGQSAWMTPAIAVTAAVPMTVSFIFLLIEPRALRGLAAVRARMIAKAEASIALLLILGLGFVHPMLAVGPLTGLAIALAAVWMSRRFRWTEPSWEYRPDEALSILSGRDFRGMVLGRSMSDTAGSLAALLMASIWTGVLITLSAGAYLSASLVISTAAVPALGFLAFWSGLCFSHLARHLGRREGGRADTTQVDLVQHDEVDVEHDPGALRVIDLSVHAWDGRSVLNGISFNVPAGASVLIEGGPGSGKSVFLRTLASPTNGELGHVRGNVVLDGVSSWARLRHSRALPMVYLPIRPLLLPGSARDNLYCFGDDATLDRGKRILEQLMLSAEAAERVLSCPDVRYLSDTQQRLLAFARAFALAPGAYLLDQPECGLTDKMVNVLARRLEQETRAGRSVLMATNDRRLIDLCTDVVVLSNGRLSDAGRAEEVRARRAEGWNRFSGRRTFESEDALEAWLRSHFQRDGDEQNRRNVCLVAFELLAVSCMGAAKVEANDLVYFEFKHAKGYCELRMLDRDLPISSGVLERARKEASAESRHERLSPLAAAISGSIALEATHSEGMRVISVRIATYDPRETLRAKAGTPDAVRSE